ncbi:hypothetical protein HK414_08715 [Ramlibacter terrae]|uniref:Aldehyde dehydrogenase family protein n=1 Tax=Ramlibacter terrae TaxID=2732511 RepID=A0ABX6P2P1_9BURK|nr:hypothetical protein HK414_08715 [Ramlibacter terrae]
MGSSKDGTPNPGIAQFEPATAKAVGLTDPTDPVEAVHAAAMHLKDAAKWSAKRIAGLKLTPEQHAQKLREGVSIYYNLSTKGRNAGTARTRPSCRSRPAATSPTRASAPARPPSSRRSCAT